MSDNERLSSCFSGGTPGAIARCKLLSSAGSDVYSRQKK